ncbi:hypothetical protein H0H93_010004, partial [Arthromyces matolae]
NISGRESGDVKVEADDQVRGHVEANAGLAWKGTLGKHVETSIEAGINVKVDHHGST